MKQEEVMLTTIDNPYDPFTEWDKWRSYDETKGYNTNGYIARIAKVGDDMSEADELFEIKNAIDEIIEMNVTGLYKKVYRTTS
jgi:hypothetical protein